MSDCDLQPHDAWSRFVHDGQVLDEVLAQLVIEVFAEKLLIL